MARVLITGANGFAGPYLAAAMASRGHEVTGLTREPDTAKVAGITTWQTADLSDPLQTAAAVRAARPDIVVHLAAISFVAHKDVSDIYASNILGTRNLLEAVAALGGISGPVTIVSSANVYGTNVGGALHEDLPVNPQSDYAISKMACEYLAAMFADKVKSFIVRPFNYTGVGQARNFIIPKIVDHVKRKAPVIELGNLDVARDFSDVRFFAEAMARLIETPPPQNEKINICSGRAYPLLEVLDIVQRLSGHKLNVVTNPAFVRSNEVKQLWGDPGKLQGLVGPLECPSLEDTLRWMLEA